MWEGAGRFSTFEETYMTEAYFELKDVTVGYDGKPLISHIDIEVKRGEVIVLIGPNGAGKSTILKSITRQLKLVGGNVVLDGDDIYSLSFADMSKHLAVVLTERLKPELMTCYDLVATGRYPYTGRLGILSAEDHRIVEEALESVHASELADRSFDAISDGQRQRLLLARAFAQEPDIIILDEPTSFLDIRYKLEFLTILRRMAKERGIVVIMSLHEIELARKAADRVVCVKGDRIFRIGAPEEVFNDELIFDLFDINEDAIEPALLEVARYA